MEYKELYISFLCLLLFLTGCALFLMSQHLRNFRLNAQAITLAALFGSAVVEYYDHNTGKKADKYAKYMHIENFQNKD